MNESGPIRKTEKDLTGAAGEYSDLVQMTSCVYRACRDGRLWLLKTAKSDDADSLQMLRREYELGRDLRHPYITAAGSFEEDTPVGPAVVMEYVEGCTLRQFVAGNPSCATRRRIIGQILDAVEYLHLHGLLHNDIKGDNIMVTTIGNDVRLIDFGLAETDADYLNRRLGGTKGTTAPEVLDGDTDSSSSGASDIYSIGKVIAELFPRRYSSIVRKCTRTLPEERYPDVDSLRRALCERDRRPWTVLAAATVFILLAAALVPDALRRVESNRAGRELQQGICRVQENLTEYYRQAADSLSDRAKVPSLDEAYAVRNNFVMRTAEYRSQLSSPELRPVCDSVYERLLVSLNRIMAGIPVE